MHQAGGVRAAREIYDCADRKNRAIVRSGWVGVADGEIRTHLPIIPPLGKTDGFDRPHWRNSPGELNIEANSGTGLSLASGTHSFGTFLVPYSNTIKLDGGTSANGVLTGALIAGGDIELQSTPWIIGAPIQPPRPGAEAPEPATIFTFFLVVGYVAHVGMKRQQCDVPS